MSKSVGVVDDSIKWAAGYLRDNPGASFADICRAKPPGLKVWKGIMGKVKEYIATGEITPRVRKEKPPTPTDEPLSIFDRINDMETRLLTLEERVASIVRLLGLKAS